MDRKVTMDRQVTDQQPRPFAKMVSSVSVIFGRAASDLLQESDNPRAPEDPRAKQAKQDGKAGQSREGKARQSKSKAKQDKAKQKAKQGKAERAKQGKAGQTEVTLKRMPPRTMRDRRNNPRTLERFIPGSTLESDSGHGAADDSTLVKDLDSTAV
jgi:hypothetical protein